MMRILLDTAAYSAFKRGHPEVKLALQQAEEIALNPVVLGELLAGFMVGEQRTRNERDLRTLLSSPRVRIFTIDDDTAARYAVIINALRAAATPVPTNDVWIGATAMQHGLRIVTTDAHFLKVTQVIVDHFQVT